MPGSFFVIPFKLIPVHIIATKLPVPLFLILSILENIYYFREKKTLFPLELFYMYVARHCHIADMATEV